MMMPPSQALWPVKSSALKVFSSILVWGLGVRYVPSINLAEPGWERGRTQFRFHWAELNLYTCHDDMVGPYTAANV